MHGRQVGLLCAVRTRSTARGNNRVLCKMDANGLW
jgi:hypothetical protein